jgi:AcrR family transcriptional regulator
MHGLSEALAPAARRAPRLRADQVRRKMLLAGKKAALEAGIGVSLEAVRMEDVIRRARVPRSSVYRMWPQRSDFVADLILYLAGPGGYLDGRQVFDAETYDVARKVMAENAQLLCTERGRRAVLCEVTRVAVTTNFARMLSDQAWRVHHALLASFASVADQDARTAIARALEQGEAQARTAMVGLIEEIMATIGLRIRQPGMRVEHLVVAGVSLLQALAVRQPLTAAATGGTDDVTTGSLTADMLPGPPGLDGRQTTWPLPALAYLGLVDSFAELDPDFVPRPA